MRINVVSDLVLKPSFNEEDVVILPKKEGHNDAQGLLWLAAIYSCARATLSQLPLKSYCIAGENPAQGWVAFVYYVFRAGRKGHT